MDGVFSEDGSDFTRRDRVRLVARGTARTAYMGRVAVTELQGGVAKELLAALGRREDWSVADLRGLPEDRPWLALLAEAAAAQGFDVEVTDDQNGAAPVPALPRAAE